MGTLNNKEGSAMSSKQLARTVKDGKLLSFRFAGLEENLTGYLCGMDDYHWMVVTASGSLHLVHKGGAIVIDIAFNRTYEFEENHSELEKVVAPFRKYVNQNFFGVSEGQVIKEVDAVSS